MYTATNETASLPPAETDVGRKEGKEHEDEDEDEDEDDSSMM